MPGPEHGGQWGIVGGAFDPVHFGHLDLAREIIRAKKLSGALFIPAYRHPFKSEQSRAPYEDRLHMLRLALAGHDSLLACDIEFTRRLSGYTIDTIRSLKEMYPKATFYFIIGADNISQIPQWRDPVQLQAETAIIAGARPGYNLEVDHNSPISQIELVPTSTADISSSELRDMIARGEPRSAMRQWVPEPVLDYIEKKQLYR